MLQSQVQMQNWALGHQSMDKDNSHCRLGLSRRSQRV